MEGLYDKLEQWAKTHPLLCMFLSNGYDDPYGNIEHVLAAGGANRCELRDADGASWLHFREFLDDNRTQFLPLLFSYDLKNTFEALQTRHADPIGFPLAGSFVPEQLDVKLRTENMHSSVLPRPTTWDTGIPENLELIADTSREAYREQFEKIRFHLLHGDIYETNYCIRFHAQAPDLNPIALFHKLNSEAPSPFAALVKWDDSWLICGSPERYMCRKGNRLISQPIKGTARRIGNPEIDAQTLKRLASDPKERAENVMITDLVRNDLSEFALPGSVNVSELCGIYPYNRVFQMISTVEAQLEEGTTLCDILERAFPMGSMTGVPKIRAMELADQIETFARGLYSGSVGYQMQPDTFDLNVVIRSFVWNARNGLLSYSTGGAITIRSNADQEYDECLLKAESLRNSLRSNS
jgi:para-aminobenzoate synthetase component 1